MIILINFSFFPFRKLEQARTKLSQLNHLLELIQNSSGLSPAYMQRVSNVLKEEGGSSSHSPSPSCSGRSQPRPSDEMSIETMQMMTRELEERTAAMKEERDKLIAARQHLQRVAGKIPVAKTETESLSPDDDSESEAPCLLPSGLDQAARDVLNATVSTDPEQIQSCSENSPHVCRTMPSRNRQRASWNTSLPTLPTASRERRKYFCMPNFFIEKYVICFFLFFQDVKMKVFPVLQINLQYAEAHEIVIGIQEGGVHLRQQVFAKILLFQLKVNWK